MLFDNFKDQKIIMRRQDLTSTERFVAVAALSFRNADSGQCNPPVVSIDPKTGTHTIDPETGEAKPSLVYLTGYSKKCVVDSLNSLETKGVITRVRFPSRPSRITFCLGSPTVTVTKETSKGEQRLPSPTYTVNEGDGKGEQRTPSGSPTFTQTNKNKEYNKEEESVASAPSFSLSSESVPTAEKPKAVEKAKKKISQTFAELGLTSLPDEWRAYCNTRRPDLDADITFFDFQDYWTNGNGRREKKKDWLLTWKNWIKKENANNQRVHRNIFSAEPSFYRADPQPEPKQEVAEEPNPFAKEGAAMIEKQIADRKKELKLIYDDDYDPEVLKEIDRRLKGKQIKRLA